MSKRAATILLSLAGMILLAILLLQVPYFKNRFAWRYEVWSSYFYSQINPLEQLPTPVPVTPTVPASISPTIAPPTQTLIATSTSTPTLEPLPAQVTLPSPQWEPQTMNNCGPATLAMTLRMLGWDINQGNIDKVVKPKPQDRNVNPDELRDYVRSLGLMSAEFRVNGNLDLLKRLLAKNHPVIIESATQLEPSDGLGPNDDRWSAHYLLITGYDEAQQVFIAQDPLRGPDKKISYEKIMNDWKPFNYMYMIVYLTENEPDIISILGDDWDADKNREKALKNTEAVTISTPDDAFAWFNLGSNLVYFERYEEAAQAFDKAITLGLPQRMTRYQFSPFFAYFNTNRIEYLLEITEATYKPINGNYSEEALLWHGYGLYRLGDIEGARNNWNKALDVHPGYYDAQVALDLIQ